VIASCSLIELLQTLASDILAELMFSSSSCLNLSLLPRQWILQTVFFTTTLLVLINNPFIVNLLWCKNCSQISQSEIMESEMPFG